MLQIRSTLAYGALLLVLGTAGPALAQAPSISTVFPPGAQQGVGRPVKINGDNLQDATQILVSGAGVRAEITANKEAGALSAELAVEEKAEPGLREVRVVTPRGTSNAGRIWVSGYHDLEEKEPNNLVTAPQELPYLPVTVDGVIGGAEDADTYSFRASAGETLVFDVVAFRMASGLDPYLAVYDAKGRIQVAALEAFDRDPRIVLPIKQSGVYTVQVRDTLYRGGAAFTYRLTVGRVPVVTSFLPRGGRSGETVQVQLEGVNLGEMKSVSVKLPMDRPTATVVPTTSAGPAMEPISLTASALPESVEAEPNDKPDQATAVGDTPTAVSGRMDKPGDRDVFRIRPKAAGGLAIEVNARRMGSRLDSALRILDASGKELNTNDDALGKDSRIVLNAQANTDYLIEVRALDGRAGGDYFYRLEIAPPAGQDFRLTVEPPFLNVARLGSSQVTVTVQRLSGFGGAVDLRVEGLPEGVVVSPAKIQPGAANTVFTLTGGENVTPGAYGLLRVVGASMINNQPVERLATPIEKFAPPLAQPNQTVERENLMLTAGVMPQQAYALEVSPRELKVKKGTQNVEIKVKAIRQMGQNGQIVISAANLPGNVAAPNVNIPANQNEVVLKVNVAANAPTVIQNIVVSGNLSNNVQTAPAVSLEITP